MKQYFPNDGRSIDQYIAVFASEKVSALYFAERAIPRCVARIAGGLMQHHFSAGPAALPPM